MKKGETLEKEDGRQCRDGGSQWNRGLGILCQLCLCIPSSCTGSLDNQFEWLNCTHEINALQSFGTDLTWKGRKRLKTEKFVYVNQTFL